MRCEFFIWVLNYTKTQNNIDENYMIRTVFTIFHNYNTSNMTNLTEKQKEGLLRELVFSAQRSSGSGGQNVNKVSTKIELRFSVWQSTQLTDQQKQIILHRLKNSINKDGELIIICQEGRSQFYNKTKAVSKFLGSLTSVLIPVKKRKQTEPSYTSKLKRLSVKKINSMTKINRQKPNSDHD